MGRKPKYTLEELEAKISHYYPQIKSLERIPTKANLLGWLDISRKTYNEWKKDGHELSNALKRTEIEIEDYWLQKLAKPACTGAIFYLKNAFKENYKDRYEQDVTSGGEKIIQIYAGKSLQRHDSDTEDIQPKEKD